jgi:hypothetical protein
LQQLICRTSKSARGAGTPRVEVPIDHERILHSLHPLWLINVSRIEVKRSLAPYADALRFVREGARLEEHEKKVTARAAFLLLK